MHNVPQRINSVFWIDILRIFSFYSMTSKSISKVKSLAGSFPSHIDSTAWSLVTSDMYFFNKSVRTVFRRYFNTHQISDYTLSSRELKNRYSHEGPFPKKHPPFQLLQMAGLFYT